MDRKSSSGCVVGRGEGVTSGMVQGFFVGVGDMRGVVGVRGGRLLVYVDVFGLV